MKNNILRELEPNLIKIGDNSYTTLDNCIKQNKIFGILFLSGIATKINNILKKFNDLFNLEEINNTFKLIICICDEEKSDFDEVFSKLSDLTCFIIPFQSDGIEKLINKYNIVSLPCLLIFDKNGNQLDSLNNSEIKNLNINNINGWNNIFNIKNNYKVDKYSIGDEGFIFGHKHILIYTDYLGKSPNYGKGNWYCDICGKTHKYNETNFYCDICGYDVCDTCYEKNKKL